MVRRIFDRLLKESINTSWHEKVKKFFGNHIREVGLFGISVEFEAPPQDLQRMVHDFAPALSNLMCDVKDEKKGILLILDDINGLALSSDFANWLKSLVDEIATAHKPFPLCLLLVGMEERRQSLIHLQPSLARVFDLVEIAAWSDHETQSFFRKAFEGVGYRIAEKPLGILSMFSGGLPVLAHEIGDAAFNLDNDNQIDEEDARRAVTKAAEIVGRKHLDPQVFEALRSKHYRSILRKLARPPFKVQFQRKEVRERLTGEEGRVFDNFLRRMEKLGVLKKNPEAGPGAYRFTNLLHYLYFTMEAERVKKSAA